MKKHLRLNAHVKFVPGHQNGALYDLQQGKVRTVPMVMQTIIQAFQESSTQEVLQSCFGGDETIFQRYTDFLLQGNWAFITTQPDRFPEANLSWESPYPINTGIVAHDFLKPYDLAAALEELSAAGCRHLELQLHNYSLDDIGSESWKLIERALRKGEFRRGTLVLAMDQTAMQEVCPTQVEECLEKWPRFGTVVILGQKENRNLQIGKRKYHLRVVNNLTDYAKKTWEAHSDTHFVGPAYFREARVANPYFNRRLAIDRQGNFKNDLLHGGEESFGSLGKRAIQEVIKDAQFQQRWLAGPDKIADTLGNPMRYCLRYDRAINVNPADISTWSFSVG